MMCALERRAVDTVCPTATMSGCVADAEGPAGTPVLDAPRLVSGSVDPAPAHPPAIDAVSAKAIGISRCRKWTSGAHELCQHGHPYDLATQR